MEYREIMPYMTLKSFYVNRSTLMPDFISPIGAEGKNGNWKDNRYCATELSAEIVYLSIRSLNKWVDEEMMRIRPRGDDIVIRERTKENEREIIAAFEGIARCGERVIKKEQIRSKVN